VQFTADCDEQEGLGRARAPFSALLALAPRPDPDRRAPIVLAPRPVIGELLTVSGTLEDSMTHYSDGDDAELSRVYDLAAPPLYAFLVRLCRNRELAEDLTHETFLRVHGARGSYRRGARVLPWMFAIGRRLFLDHLRSRRREGPSLDAPRSDGERKSDPGIAAQGASADDLSVASQLAARIEDLLAAMPETQATAFRLLKQEHLTIAEAASVLGATEMTVKLRAHRAYESLRNAIGREWDLAGTGFGATLETGGL
jgi:RNA polymerase sigma-70 factor (ECF subfamily)